MRFVIACCLVLLLPPAAVAQSPAARYVGRPVTAVVVALEGRISTDPALADLVEHRVGQPLAMSDVRDSIAHLFSLGRFQDVQVEAEGADGGVRLRYNLIPVHGVSRVDFSGQLGLSDGTLRRAVMDRFGEAPPIGRVADVIRLLTQVYADHGYLRPAIAPKTAVLHDPDRTILTFEIASGPRARIGRVEVVGDPLEPQPRFLQRIGAVTGAWYERPAIERELTKYVEELKDEGRYEAFASLGAPRIAADGTTADLTIDVQPGPVVTIAFAGDPIPKDRWDDLVPIEREGAADEDLLEDSVRRIEEHLRQQGYWRARAPFERQLADGRLTIRFTVNRGLQYRLATDVEITGNRAIPLAELRPLAARLQAGAPYIESHLTAAVAAVGALYRSRGYAQVKVEASERELTSPRPGEGLVQPIIRITEGPLTVLGTITFTGNVSVNESELRPVFGLEAGMPFVEGRVAAAQDRLVLRYLNLGFASANASIAPRLNADGSRIDLDVRVVEGPRTIVDHIIIVGNRRTDPQIIRRELRLRSGEPLGLDDRLESQRRLGALGLFRRVSVQPLSHGDVERQDVLVTVEEAPATSIGYGGGLEVSRILRKGAGGAAEERIEFAPRGSFDIGRRNLGGKNRSINLFTRLGLRPDDDPDDPEGGSLFGFADYRVIATYRQPRLLGANDATITGAVEQGVRSSFNFARKGGNAEIMRILIPGVRVTARYSFGTTRTFDINLGEEDDPIRIDRLFPRVRLSSFSGAISRDTRDDVVEPAHGTLLSAEGSVAARALGGNVGFMKTYMQAFWFAKVPLGDGAVLATRMAVGLADGFKREVPGQGVVVDNLPASERFFAGGETTIRGFALDRVGEPATINANGFPEGGNAVTILNAELRVPVWNRLGAVFFVDGGNVFERVANFDLGELRGSAGFGLRFRSPVGPIRLDLGFKLDPRDGERRRGIHLGIGHAF